MKQKTGVGIGILVVILGIVTTYFGDRNQGVIIAILGAIIMLLESVIQRLNDILQELRKQNNQSNNNQI